MSLYNTVKTMFGSKRKEDEEKDDEKDEISLTREDLEHLEKIIKASKKALFGLKRNIETRKKNPERQEQSSPVASNGPDKRWSKQIQRDNFEQNEDIPSSTPVNDEEFAFLESSMGNRSTHGGIAFEVDFGPARRVRAKPKELHPEISPMKQLVEYSSEEKTLMAEIIRDDLLTLRSNKAALTDTKRFDATRRRLVMSADAEARAAERQNEATADPAREMEERSRRLKKLAAKAKEARLAAASKRNKS